MECRGSRERVSLTKARDQGNEEHVAVTKTNTSGYPACRRVQWFGGAFWRFCFSGLHGPTYLGKRQPLVVSVPGMGEDLPVAVMPGETGPSIDRSLFSAQKEALRFFDAAGKDDLLGLDGDGDGVACKSEE